MSKYYFRDYNDYCYTIDCHKEYMKENGITEMIIYEAKVDRGIGFFFVKILESLKKVKNHVENNVIHMIHVTVNLVYVNIMATFIIEVTLLI
jgi:hypothetical protein